MSPLTPQNPAATSTPASPAPAAAAALRLAPLTHASSLALSTLIARSAFRSSANAGATPVHPLVQRKRAAVVSWLLELTGALAENPCVPAMAVSYFDAYLQSADATKMKDAGTSQFLQLVACAAFLIATKMCETVSPTLDELAYLTDRTCDRELIGTCEMLMCVSLNFDMCVRNPHDVLPHLCRLAAGLEPEREIEKEKLCDRTMYTDMDNENSPMTVEPTPRRSRPQATPLRCSLMTPTTPAVQDQRQQKNASISNWQLRTTATKRQERKEAEASAMTRLALALADVALHCRGLIVAGFGIGEITAACFVAARAAVHTSAYPDATVFAAPTRPVDHTPLWLPLFDKAGLSFGRVVAAAAIIVDYWGDIVMRRVGWELLGCSERRFRSPDGVDMRSAMRDGIIQRRKAVINLSSLLPRADAEVLFQSYNWTGSESDTDLNSAIKWNADCFRNTYVIRRHDLLRHVKAPEVLVILTRYTSLYVCQENPAQNEFDRPSQQPQQPARRVLQLLSENLLDSPPSPAAARILDHVKPTTLETGNLPPVRAIAKKPVVSLRRSSRASSADAAAALLAMTMR
jgi:Cyclin, N-terminal domain